MKTIYLAVALMLSSLMISCTGSTEASAEDKAPDPYHLLAQAADSVKRAKAKSGSTATRRPAALTHKLKSYEDAVAYMKSTGHWDEYSQGVIPSIASQDITYAEKLLKSKFPHFIIADKGSMNVLLYDKYGRQIKAYKMACSRHYGTKHKFRDNRTPEGFFSAEGIYDSTDWLYTNDDGYTSPAKGVYGPRFIRLQTPVTRSVGIHGTNAPHSTGKRCSHGCMRLNNKHIAELVKYVQKGMPIIVNPSAQDDAVNRKEGCKVTMLAIGKIVNQASVTPDEPAQNQSEEKAAKPAPADSVAKSEAPAPVAEKESTETAPAPAVKETPEEPQSEVKGDA